MTETATPKRYWIWTVGCQMNKVDSDRVADTLRARGYLPAEREEDADIIILNSCAVRESAERRVSGKLGNLVALREEKPDLLLGLTGCSVSPDFDATRKRFKGADMYFQPTRIDQFLEQLDQRWPAPQDAGVMACWEEQSDTSESKGPVAYVPISNGCDKFCTYCIVPYRRGRERSRPAMEIVDECGSLVKAGVKEITLLGQRVNAYGRDFKNGTDLADLLVLVDGIPGLQRLRFLTSYPRDMSDKLIGTIAELNKVCEHIHLPVQAGNNVVLENMRRGYTREDYLQLAGRIRAAPGIALSTDIIVGFPGETEAQFQDTLSLIEEVGFSTVYVAAYSPRAGTLSSRWPDDVSAEEKKDRVQRLNAVQERISLGQHQSLRGAEVEILVESTESERRDLPQWQGRTRQNRRVFVPRGEGEDLIGQTIRVRVEKVSPWAMQAVPA